MPQPSPHCQNARRLTHAVRSAIAASLLATVIAAPLHAQPASPSNPDPAPSPTPATAPAVPPTGPVTERPAPAGGVAPVTLEGLPILRVEVVGATRTDTRLILDQVRAQAGQVYSRQQVDVDVRSIASLDRFITVRAEVVPVAPEGQGQQIRGVVVRFLVEERPVVSVVEIRGNRALRDPEIRDALISRGSGTIDPFSLETDRQTIIKMYQKKGYAQAAVTIDQEALKEGIIRFNIIEGPRAHIRAVRFDGNANLKSDYLRFKIQTQPSFWIFRKGILDEEKIQQDLVTIRDLYLKRGYLDARVSYFLDFSPDKTKISVRFAIVEGPRYKVGNITLSGNTVFSTEELLGDRSKFGIGSWAEQDKIDALQRRIEDKYGHEGYINRDVVVNKAYTEAPGIVDLNINITEGNPFIVGRIIIRGNANVQERVVRRQIRIYPDQTYDTVLVRRSVERLKSIRIFQDAKITPIGDSPDTRDALVEVAEGQTGRFLVGAGVSSNSGLVGQVSLEQMNFDILNPPKSLGEFLRGQSFKGAGQYFRILLEPGTEFQQYRVTFEEPYLYDSPYSFGNDLYYFTRSRESWNERRIGDILSFGRRFGDVWGINLAFRAEEVSISDVEDENNNGRSDAGYFLFGEDFQFIGPRDDSAQEILDEKGSHFLTSIKPSIVRDTTNSRVFPSEGSRTALSIEQYGALGGDITATKLVFRFDKYFTLYEDLFERKTTLALRNEIGYNVLGDLPFYERFYAGGIGSLRGFRFRGVSPRKGPLEDPVGGEFMWVSTIEVNYPIWENILRGVAFVDIGTVEEDIGISSIRADVGIGARITIPFFGQLPLALDLAFPVSKKDGDRTQILSFALGIPF